MDRLKRILYRSSIVLFLLFLLLSSGILVIGLWGGSGTILDLIAGQLPPRVRIENRAASVMASSDSYSVSVAVDKAQVINTLPPEFLSFSIDSAQVVGSPWWNPSGAVVESGSGTASRGNFNFDRPHLEYMAKQLSPAYLRLGGSEADRLWYQMDDHSPVPNDPAYRAVLDARTWDSVNTFANRSNLKIIFTVNAGPGPHAPKDSSTTLWNPENATSFLRYTKRHRYRIALWEFGNELNGYWFVHGSGSLQNPENYGRDYLAFSTLAKSIDATAKIAPQSSAFWPIAGEAFSPILGFMPRSLVGLADQIDVLSWHYYPQESRRAPFATRRADPARMLDPAALDEASHWAAQMRTWRDQYAPGKPIWLGETGNAQFGGEPGVSDAYIGGLWWVDELGLMAQEGMSVVVRQTLAGSNYGLLDEASLEPRPDYWNSWMWKQWMGNKVYKTTIAAGAQDDTGSTKKLRAYAHSFEKNGATTCLLLINLDTQRSANVALPVGSDQKPSIWIVTSPDVFGKVVLVNDVPLKLDAKGHVPVVKPLEGGGNLRLPPLSYAFVAY